MTPEEFKNIYPQFSGIGDDIITRHFNDFEVLYFQIDFGNKQDMGIGLYTAHFLTLESNVDKDNILEALNKGTFVDSEKTPEFQVHYAVPASFGKSENFEIIKQTLVNDPYSKVYGINFLYAFESDLFKLTMYGVKLIYLLWMIYQADLAKRQEEEAARVKNAPAAIMVRMC